MKEEEDLTASPNNFLSTREGIDAYLRAQNDAYLAKVKSHLKRISQSANAINAVLPELSRRAASIRPPSDSTSYSGRNSIPAYTVSQWRKSSEANPTITQSLVEQVDRLMKNIEDLEAEPYRADVTLSERDKVSQKVSNWTTHEKEMELFNAGLQRTGMEARFKMGVQRLADSVTAMAAAREEKVAAKAREEPVMDSSSASTTASSSEGPPVSYRPLSGIATAAVPAVATPKREGWGAAPTKIEAPGKYHSRTPNPFKKAQSASANNAKEGLEPLRQKLEGDAETATTPSSKNISAPKADIQAAELNGEPKAAEMKAQPKVRKLADLQRQMDASQRKSD